MINLTLVAAASLMMFADHSSVAPDANALGTRVVASISLEQTFNQTSPCDPRFQVCG